VSRTGAVVPERPGRKDVTALLSELNAGKEGAEEALLPLIYNELHALAHCLMGQERVGHTLQTTALVHEAYLRLCGAQPENWESKSHYMRVAARAMRRVLIDCARRKDAQKRGRRPHQTTLQPEMTIQVEDALDLLALDQALDHLSDLHPRMGQVVELRYFCGLTLEETSEVLGISLRTAKSDWSMARAWLKDEMS
jgi:RNA polymerase sigma factor (TIGR02999 family)